jgi:membrane-associated phospholipid phosphatase
MFARDDASAKFEGAGGEFAIKTPFPSDGSQFRTYLFWAWWAGMAFFAVYPTTNWLTSLRPSPFHLYVLAELDVPFVPQFVWAYLSMYVLFVIPPFVLRASQMPALGKQLIAGTLISGLLFLLLPAELGFVRTVPIDAPYAGIYAAMFGVDRPYNLVPSLHVVFSTAIALACADVASPAARAVLLGWLALIAASTIFVHQHHVLDVAAAFVLVFLLRHRYEVTYA